MEVAALQWPPPTAEEPPMKSPTAKRMLGAIVAAVTLTMVTSVAPASAGEKQNRGGNGGISQMRGDTGWDIP